MYDVIIKYPNGEEEWIDYGWLYRGCINDLYFNWMYCMWTCQSPDITSLRCDISRLPYIVELPSDEKRFVLEKI
jgi:hypothetical protein